MIPLILGILSGAFFLLLLAVLERSGQIAREEGEQ